MRSPHKGGAVDRNRAGRHFGNGNQIGEFLQGHPGCSSQPWLRISGMAA